MCRSRGGTAKAYPERAVLRIKSLSVAYAKTSNVRMVDITKL